MRRVVIWCGVAVMACLAWAALRLVAFGLAVGPVLSAALAEWLPLALVVGLLLIPAMAVEALLGLAVASVSGDPLSRAGGLMLMWDALRRLLAGWG